MSVSPLAGKPATKEMLIDPARLEREYYERRPDFADPGQRVSFGTSDAPATLQQKARLERLSPDAVKTPDLAGDPIVANLTRAPGNDAPIGGLKVVSRNGWFAARPSGTEAAYKIYAESFRDEAHLEAILANAREIVDEACRAA